MDTNSEVRNEKITVSVRCDPSIHAAITALAAEEDRPSLNNMIERLLKTHPRVMETLETTEVTA